MASRASNFCIDAADPYAQTMWWAKVLEDFTERGATLYGVSCDSVWAQQAFREKLGTTIEQLSDFEPKGEVARTYGVYRQQDGTSERALFVIDADGVVRWSYVSPVGINPGADGILRALEGLGTEDGS